MGLRLVRLCIRCIRDIVIKGKVLWNGKIHALHLVMIFVPLIALGAWVQEPFAPKLLTPSVEQKQPVNSHPITQTTQTVTNSSNGNHTQYFLKLADGVGVGDLIGALAYLHQDPPTEKYTTPHPEPALIVLESPRKRRVQLEELGKITQYVWVRRFFCLNAWST